MAATKISEKIAATLLALVDKIVLVQGGVTKSATFQLVLDLINANKALSGIINGGCQVAQNSANTFNLSTTSQYGQVDQFTAWASTGAVSAGTITQVLTSTIGRTGAALKLAGVTLTGAAVLSVRHRMRGKNAVKYKNKTGSFAVQVLHDVGSNINYTVIIRKPTALDNYAATTVIATSSAQSVATATGTQVKFENVALGDCTNGIEIEVQAACGAVTTKNFEFTEFQLDDTALIGGFKHVEAEVDYERCRRAYEKSFNDATGPAQNAGTVGAFSPFLGTAGAVSSRLGYVRFATPKDATPTMIFYNPSAANAFARNTTLGTDATATSGDFIGETGFSVLVTGLAAWAVGNTIAVHWSADARLSPT
jgi:hypothetical protein